ncbi:MAG: tyrosine-type recombinase/integrase, partial [Gemmataceae bacterium]
MPKPFKLQCTRPLPPDAVIIDREGKPHLQLKTRGRTTYFPLTKNGRGYLCPSKCWYFEHRDDVGTIVRVKGFADLKATEQLAAETERKIARKRVGIIDPNEDELRRPLVEHLSDYATHLAAKGGTSAYIELSVGRILKIATDCGFAFAFDFDALKVEEWLNASRRDAVPVALPPGDSFSPSDAAELLGISGAAVRATIKRLNLSATGAGKARRLPRGTLETIALQQGKGCGPETVNHYIRALRGFFNWMVRAKRIGRNPVETLSLVNAAVDVRRTRRELTANELQRLFVAARSSNRTFRGLTGEGRYYLYLVAAGTGFRASALANLTPGDFDLSAATVTLPARFNKSKRTKVQPLPTDVAAALVPFLSAIANGECVWGGTWAADHRGAEMLRIDLEAAGIAYATEGPDGPEYADFHALRHSFLT